MKKLLATLLTAVSLFQLPNLMAQNVEGTPVKHMRFKDDKQRNAIVYLDGTFIRGRFTRPYAKTSIDSGRYFNEWHDDFLASGTDLAIYRVKVEPTSSPLGGNHVVFQITNVSTNKVEYREFIDILDWDNNKWRVSLETKTQGKLLYFDMKKI